MTDKNEQPKDCQNSNLTDVCRIGRITGICCSDESCDIDDGITEDPTKPQARASEGPEQSASKLPEWLNSIDIHSGREIKLSQLQHINRILTAKFGPPSEHCGPAAEARLRAENTKTLCKAAVRHLEMQQEIADQSYELTVARAEIEQTQFELDNIVTEFGTSCDLNIKLEAEIEELKRDVAQAVYNMIPLRIYPGLTKLGITPELLQ